MRSATTRRHHRSLSDPYGNDTQATYRYIGTAPRICSSMLECKERKKHADISSLAVGMTKVDDYDVEPLHQAKQDKPQMMKKQPQYKCSVKSHKIQ